MLSVSMGEMLSRNAAVVGIVRNVIEGEIRRRGYDLRMFEIHGPQKLGGMCYVGIYQGGRKIVDGYITVKEELEKGIINGPKFNIVQTKCGDVEEFLDRFEREYKLKAVEVHGKTKSS